MFGMRFVVGAACVMGLVTGCVAPVEGTGAPEEHESAAAASADEADAGRREVAPAQEVDSVHCCTQCGESSRGACVQHP